MGHTTHTEYVHVIVHKYLSDRVFLEYYVRSVLFVYRCIGNCNSKLNIRLIHTIFSFRLHSEFNRVIFNNELIFCYIFFKNQNTFYQR